jgi:phosphoserine phosphatase
VALLASSLEQHGGRLTGRYHGPQCASEEKARRVREDYDLSTFARVYAYGDTVEDLPMLALADEAVYRGRRWLQRAGGGPDGA